MLESLAAVFRGIVYTMSGVHFLGISLWDYSVGLSVLALCIGAYRSFFGSGDSRGGDD